MVIATRQRRLVLLGGAACHLAMVECLRLKFQVANALPHSHSTTMLGLTRPMSHMVLSPSQCSLHNEPIFRLLLKVAVNGTHQCESLNFCGALAPIAGECWVLYRGVCAYLCLSMCVFMACVYVCMHWCATLYLQPMALHANEGKSSSKTPAAPATRLSLRKGQ